MRSPARCSVPEEAVRAGFLDEIVAPDALAAHARARAAELAGIDRGAHAATKVRIRAEVIEAVRDGRERILGTGREW